MLKKVLFIVLCFIPLFLYSQDSSSPDRDLADSLTVDLREPLYERGILSTEKGGVITGPNIRIQARHIRYTRIQTPTPVLFIEANDQLMIEFDGNLFVGDSLVYDFIKKEGVIINGRSGIGPWYFGGETIELLDEGNYVIHEGYLTTSENANSDWGIFANQISIENNRYVFARRVQVRVGRLPVFWLSSFRTSLDSIFESPIRYRFRWGGRQGPRVGFTYQVFSLDHLKTFFRFDYRLTRGPGGGIEVYYHSPDYKTRFESVNYLACDSSLLHPNRKLRYRFEGIFQDKWDQDKMSMLVTYDKLSDREIPSSYYDKDFDFEIAKRTQVLVRRQESDWIGFFYSRIKVNGFQTVKQELPTLALNLKPYSWERTGAIVENWAKVSYLDFQYSDCLLHVHDYSSTRIEYRPKIYRPFLLGPWTWTPEAGAVAIFYGNSPEHDSKLLTLGFVGHELRTQLHRYYGQNCFKHVIEPYLRHDYYTYPSVSPNDHYIFDIQDGWYTLNQVTIGMKNLFYAKRQNECVTRLMSLDLYTYAFLDTPHDNGIPKFYARLTLSPLPTLRHVINTAWDFEHQQLDHFNFRSEWTLNADFAVAAELRHRSAYSWRKVDEKNFFLDMFRSEESLKHSPLSDRRDTFLLHFFYRFHPTWSCEFAARHGWNRHHEPAYTEYEFNLLTTIQTAWHLKLSYQHRERDDRVAVYVNVGLSQPKISSCEDCLTCYEN